MVMSPCRLSSLWWNLTTGRRALLTTWTLWTLGTQRLRIAATRSRTSAGEAVDRSISDRIESSERPSSDMPSTAWRMNQDKNKTNTSKLFLLTYITKCTDSTNYCICKSAIPALWWTWHRPGRPWCFPGPGRGLSHRSGYQTYWQMSQTAESGCLKPIQAQEQQWESWSLTRFCTFITCVYKGHLEKTQWKPLAGAEPASLWPFFHFLPIGIAQRCTASVHPPVEKQKTVVHSLIFNKAIW